MSMDNSYEAPTGKILSDNNRTWGTVDIHLGMMGQNEDDLSDELKTFETRDKNTDSLIGLDGEHFLLRFTKNTYSKRRTKTTGRIPWHSTTTTENRTHHTKIPFDPACYGQSTIQSVIRNNINNKRTNKTVKKGNFPRVDLHVQTHLSPENR